jgi:two-component system response regulator PhoP
MSHAMARTGDLGTALVRGGCLSVVRHRTRVLGKDELAAHLYPRDEERDSNVIEVLIGRLRRKLDPDGTLQPLLTLRGRGYRFTLGDGGSG